jgi:pyrroloquinoline quinone (PQQ) biosynthesis protein C
MIIELSNSKEKQAEILEAVKSSLGVLNNFLTGMERAYC